MLKDFYVIYGNERYTMIRKNLRTLCIIAATIVMIFGETTPLVIDVYAYYENTELAKRLEVDEYNKLAIIKKPTRQPISAEPEPTTKVELSIEEMIRDTCEEYGIDYEIVLAIARLETGWFKSDAYLYGNNPGGLSINEVPMAFDTREEGVDAFVSNLANNYFALGLDTPEEIGEKYCPVNPTWSSVVRELMLYEY